MRKLGWVGVFRIIGLHLRRHARVGQSRLRSVLTPPPLSSPRSAKTSTISTAHPWGDPDLQGCGRLTTCSVSTRARGADPAAASSRTRRPGLAPVQLHAQALRLPFPAFFCGPGLLPPLTSTMRPEARQVRSRPRRAKRRAQTALFRSTSPRGSRTPSLVDPPDGRIPTSCDVNPPRMPRAPTAPARSILGWTSRCMNAASPAASAARSSTSSTATATASSRRRALSRSRTKCCRIRASSTRTAVRT